jgi:hypothetical protein
MGVEEGVEEDVGEDGEEEQMVNLQRLLLLLPVKTPAV